MLSMSFTTKRRVAFGRGLYVVGNLPELGSWNPLHSVKLFWRDGDNWTQTVAIELPAGLSTLSVEYKFLETRFDRIDLRDLVWEKGPDRVSEVHLCDIKTSSSSSTLTQKTPLQKLLELRDDPGDQPTALNFRKKKKPSHLTKAATPPTVHSLDCHGMAPSVLLDHLQRHQSADFLLLQRVQPLWVRCAWSHLKRHMAYFDETEDDPSTCMLLYDFARWRFLRGDALRLPSEARAVWGVFLNTTTGEKVAVSSMQPAGGSLQCATRLAALFKKAAACASATTLDKFIWAADSAWQSEEGPKPAGSLCDPQRAEAGI